MHHHPSLLSLVLVAGAAAPTPPPRDVGTVRGIVYDALSGERLPRVLVDCLEGGVVSRAVARSNAEGEFAFEVEGGVYDVRASAPTDGYISTVLSDVDVESGRIVQVELELTTRESGLLERGFEPESFLDEDRDFVPDAFERAWRLDPELADTDEDGVLDGVGVWLAVGTRSAGARSAGVRSTGARPGGPIVSPLGRLPVRPGVPLPIVTDAIAGATRYVVEVLPRSGPGVLARQVFDFDSGEVVVGEGVALRWTPPAGMLADRYRLAIHGLGPGCEEALRDPLMVELETCVPAAEALVVEEHTELSGSVHASSVRIRKGATLRVPEGKLLYLTSGSDIVVERGAAIEGAGGASLYLAAGASIDVRGAITAGAGTAGAPVRGSTPDALAVGRGGDGGDLMLVANGAVRIFASGRTRSGAGGPGGAPENPAGLAGDGGAGGRFVLLAPRVAVADRPARIQVGSGGRGADGPLPGIGGASGDVWLADWDLRADRFIPLGADTFPVTGGRAGEAGVFADGGGAGTAAGTRTGLDDAPTTGRKGNKGWLVAGAGQAARAIGGTGSDGGRGGDGSARGGEGGDVARLGLGRGAFELLFAFAPTAGAGGDARAEGGDASSGTSAGSVGRGGVAAAFGGAGGRGLRLPVAIPSIGGAGGKAIAGGGRGATGVHRCEARGSKGGSGSSGGDATAEGGDGGEALWYGGSGGPAQAFGGSGGRGGNGGSPGAGGSGGSGTAHGGRGASGELRRGGPGRAEHDRGARGARGEVCGP